MLGTPIGSGRVVDLRGAEVDAKRLDSGQIVANEGAGTAANVEKPARTAQMGGDRPELQVVPAVADADFPLVDLVVETPPGSPFS